MASDRKQLLEPGVPSLKGAATFRLKAMLLQLKRSLLDAADREVRPHPLGHSLRNEEVIAQSVSALWRGEDDDVELSLLAGKAHNLRTAIRRLDGVEVPAGAVFSFWAQVGRPSRLKGYVKGRELREGCLIPTVGGGICQLSNHLYDAALSAGFEVVERHAHTRIIPGSLAEVGRDATVFWNYVDLRFRADAPFRIEASMTRDHLTVRLRAERKSGATLSVVPDAGQAPLRPAAGGDCTSCGVTDCFRNSGRAWPGATFGRSAYLLDEYWPEFDRYVQSSRMERDLLFIPLDGRKFRKSNYAWDTAGFRRVRQSRLATLHRAAESRRLSLQGAARQEALLRHDSMLARSFAARLPYDVTHVTVMQNLLPFLWRDGRLGGRSFDVLMTRLPMALLHKTLDAAHAAHPESNTLADFRADAWLVEAEAEALAHAGKIITPHTAIAGHFKDRAVLIDWLIPEVKRRGRAGGRTSMQARSKRVLFPGPVVGRKGIYELRKVASDLGLEVLPLGVRLEGGGFWRPPAAGDVAGGWLDDARAVVLPAYVEHKPRKLLEAVALGIPVIASNACGLGNVAGVINIRTGDVEALRGALELVLGEGAN